MRGALVTCLVVTGAGVFPLAACAVQEEPPVAAEQVGAPPGMVLISGGELVMGRDGVPDEGPIHTVRLDQFYLDKREVTNAQYLAFCLATDHRLPAYWGTREFHTGPDFPDHPVVFVSWFDAQDYAQWAGKRLPTEAEWEYAARGGLAGAPFPTGTDIDHEQARFGSEDSVEVGSYPANGYGLFDMAGNVAEWVLDYYHPDYYASSPASNPRGPDVGKLCVIRGGGWHGGKMCVRVDGRNALRPGWVDFAVGFRCAKDARVFE